MIFLSDWADVAHGSDPENNVCFAKVQGQAGKPNTLDIDILTAWCVSI